MPPLRTFSCHVVSQALTENCVLDELRGSARRRGSVNAGAAGRALFGPRNAAPFHFPVQHRTLHPQTGGGSLGTAHYPACLAEGTQDVLALSVGQREPSGGRPRSRGRRAEISGRRIDVGGRRTEI